jgi:2-haloacid dehalogenase
MSKRPELLIFDVNETLLDMEPIRKAINETLKSVSAFDLWFSKLLQLSFAESLTGEYRDFSKIGKASLGMIAHKLSVEVSEEKIKEILSNSTKLPPHPEVSAALEELKAAGFKMVALTNGGLETAEKQLKFAGIRNIFEDVYSVESVEKFKPHPETYNYVLKQQKVNPEKSMLIAAHDWDILGAQRAGLQTGFISRPGKFLYPFGKKPEAKGKTLSEIADYLASKS